MLTSAVMFSPSALAWRSSATPLALERRQMCTRGLPAWPAPKARSSSSRVCRAMVSAAAGMPARPMRLAMAPLAATPAPSQASCGRSQTA